MASSIGPDVADAALALRRSHPHAPAVDVLDIVLRHRTGCVAAFVDAVDPPAPFALLIAEAFDRGMTPAEWRDLMGPDADPQLVAALRKVWTTHVLPRFAARFGLTT